ncbi:MAG: YncE family protein, partial [Acidobacteriota bacterium]|nr:YncE family protein [Acidobacteriota bacterium]
MKQIMNLAIACSIIKKNWRASVVVLCSSLLLTLFCWTGGHSVKADTVIGTVPAGSGPNAVAVNPVTNKIYVANSGSGNVTVIDGTNNSTTTVAAGSTPVAVAINSVTNKIYVANADSNNVTVIDGTNNSTQTVAAGSQPNAVAVNSETNKIYVTNLDSNNIT